METYDLMKDLYDGMRTLSKGSDELDTLVSRSNPTSYGFSAYNLTNTVKGVYNGISGRMKLWKDKILPYFFNLPAVEMAKEKGLELKVSNNFFRSRISVYDPETNCGFKVKTPWFSSLFSRLFGHFFKSKLNIYSTKQNHESAPVFQSNGLGYQLVN